MSESFRPTSEPAVVPDDVTDPLLWRLAAGVAAEHHPGADGRCHNLQCAAYPGMCPPAAWADRAMRLARGLDPGPVPVPVPADPGSGVPPAPARGAAPAPNTPDPWLRHPVPTDEPRPEVWSGDAPAQRTNAA